MDAKYDHIGKNYDATRRADPYITKQLIKHLHPTATGIYLDIGCGTGNYTHELQTRGFSCIGIDPSIKMLEKAKQRNKHVTWQKGTAAQMSLTNSTVDGIMACLTIHHWEDIKQSFQELYRVAKSPSRLVIFTATPKQMQGYWLNYYFPKMLADASKQMPGLKTIYQVIRESGFTVVATEKYNVQPNLKDWFLCCGKQHPERYLKEHIRNGISSFAALANQEEVTHGLAQLRKDIALGKIEKLTKSYENDMGDYLFIVCEKSDDNPELLEK
ncbi:MAG: class I SAM-dependent methyltransferase [Bacteroidota bacterium]